MQRLKASINTCDDVNADIDTIGEDGRTPLTRAVEENKINNVSILLERKADINKRDSATNNDTPLTSASINGYHEIARLLCEHKADLTIPNCWGYFPLTAAARNNHPQVVKVLLEQKADVNYGGKNNIPALSYAAPEGHSDVVKILLEKRADINKRNKWGGTPLKTAIHHKKILAMMNQEQQKNRKITFLFGLFYDKKNQEKKSLKSFSSDELFDKNTAKIILDFM